MTLKALARTLDEVAAYLPFAVEDYARANEAFARWRRTKADEDLKIVELWLYAYTRRYFLAKFTREPVPPAALDEPVGEAYRRARRALRRVEQPDRFAAYVSVVCKRVFLTYAECLTHAAVVDLDRAPELPADPEENALALDLPVLVLALQAALARLPDFLREVATRRLLDGVSYEELAAQTGHSPAVLRSYLHKALARLRQDPALRAFLRNSED